MHWLSLPGGCFYSHGSLTPISPTPRDCDVFQRLIICKEILLNYVTSRWYIMLFAKDSIQWVNRGAKLILMKCFLKIKTGKKNVTSIAVHHLPRSALNHNYIF